MSPEISERSFEDARLNEETRRLHAANLFAVVRQVRFSTKNENSLDRFTGLGHEKESDAPSEGVA